MGVFEGLLSGFTGRKSQIEDQRYAEAQRSRQREAAIFESLINSPDPEVKSLAIAGLLDSAGPGKRKRGFSGWLGELESSTYLPQIQALVNTPVEEEQTVPGIPSRRPTQQFMSQAILSPPPGIAPAALPGQSPVEPGAPPPTMPTAQQSPTGGIPGAAPGIVASNVQAPGATPPPGVGQPPPSMFGPMQAGPEVGRTDKVLRPRSVFPTSFDQAMDQAKGQYLGRARGLQEALRSARTPEEKQLVLELSGYNQSSRGGTTSYGEGEIITDPNSPTGFSQIMYSRADPTQQIRIPASAPLSRSTRAANTLETIAFAQFGDQYPGATPRTILEQLTPQQVEEARTAFQEEQAATAGAVTTARGVAESKIPLSTSERADKLMELQGVWRKAEAPFREMERAYQIMRTGLDRFGADPVGSSEAIRVTFEKILDPDSVVREGEYARQGQGLSLLDRLDGMWQRYATGGGEIPEPILREMVETARQFVEGQKNWNALEKQRLTGNAGEFGISPDLLFGTTQGAAGAPPPAPPPAAGITPTSAGAGAPAPAGPRAEKRGNTWVIVTP